MEYPPVVIRGGKIRDCVNVVFHSFSVEEVESMLSFWIPTSEICQMLYTTP